LFSELKFQRWCFLLASEEGILARETSPDQWADAIYPEITIEIATRWCNINALVYKGDRCYINSFFINPYLVSHGLGTLMYQYFESFIIRKYKINRFCLQPLVRRATGARPAEDAGVFWKKMGFDYPDGADILKLNPAARKGEAPERVQISQQQLNMIAQGRASGTAPHVVENGRIWMAEDMWKDVTGVAPNNVALPPEVQAEVNLDSIRAGRPFPPIYFDFDDASPTKLSRKPLDQLSYDRTSKPSLVNVLRRAYIALCNPTAAVRSKTPTAPPRPLTTQRVRIPTIRYRDKLAHTRNVRPRIDVIDPVPIPVDVPALTPQQQQTLPPATVLRAPQTQKTQEEYNEKTQMFNDFLKSPLTPKEREEHQNLFNKFMNKP
jgi:hypothetical protein